MSEILSENQFEENKNPEKKDPKDMNFEELKSFSKEISDLAKTSFKETENGFVNADNEYVSIIKEGGQDVYKITGISDSLPKFHFYVLHGSNKNLEKGYIDKEEMMQAIREMIEKTGNRIIK